MSTATAAVVASAMALSAALTALVRRLALAHGVLDVPNQRSSHSIPTPRGGGVSIVLVVIAGLFVLSSLRSLSLDLLLALIGGGLSVAAVGFLDDRATVHPFVRLLVHAAAAVWAVVCLGGLPPLQLGHQLVHLEWIGDALAALGIIWALNLFNFMDGIDGIAASEAVFVSWSAAVLALFTREASSVSPVSWTFGAACCGFLLWNWPPARIFMGDVGSGFLGYVIGVLALADARDNPVNLLVWLILCGAFFVDATVTLARRCLRREPVYQAHRSHAYQWLARRWGSHCRTTLTIMAVNAFWLLPCAWLTLQLPHYAIWIAAGALLPLVGLALMAGAGKGEGSMESRSNSASLR